MNVRPTEKDLVGLNWPMVLLFAYLTFYVPIGAVLTILLIVFVNRFGALSPFIFGAWTAVFTAVPIIPGVLLLRSRMGVVLRRDFARIFRIREIGRVLRGAGLFVFLADALVLCAVYVLQTPDVTMYLIISFYGGTILFGAGGLMDSYFDVFTSRTLARLYFGQARETSGAADKLRMLHEGFKAVRLAANEFQLDFDSSVLERNYAIRLFDGQNVDRELDGVSVSLSRDEVLPALNEMGAGIQDLFKLKVTARQRAAFSLSVAKDYGEFLWAIAAILTLIVQVVIQVALQHPFHP